MDKQNRPVCHAKRSPKGIRKTIRVGLSFGGPRVALFADTTGHAACVCAKEYAWVYDIIIMFNTRLVFVSRVEWRETCA